MRAKRTNSAYIFPTGTPPQQYKRKDRQRKAAREHFRCFSLAVNFQRNERYQKKNTNTVLTVIRQLEALGYMYRFRENDKARQTNKEVADGLKTVCEITGLKGRWQTISTNPTIVCDTGHNVAGWEYISRQLSMVKCNKMHIVFGIVEDKDMDGIMDLLPKDAVYYFTKPKNKRAVSENVLKIIGSQKGLIGESYPSVIDACQSAKNAAAKDDFVFIGGSSYVVAELLKNSI